MTVGTVEWVNADTGYGLIAPGSGEDVLVPFSVIQSTGDRSPAEGRVVELDIGQGQKGPQAANVRLLEPQERARGARPGSSAGRLLCILDGQPGVASTSDDFLAISVHSLPTRLTAASGAGVAIAVALAAKLSSQGKPDLGLGGFDL